jgi:hypothetical protein
MNCRRITTVMAIAGVIQVLALVFLLSRAGASQISPDKVIYTDITITNESFEGTFPPAAWSATGHWGQANCEASAGSFSAWAEGNSELGCEGLDNVYHPNDNSRLIFGPFDLSDATTAALQFDAWLWSAEGDTFSWGASIDGSSFYGPSLTNEFSTMWESKSLDLAAVPTLGDLRGEENVWIAFTWQSDEFAETFGGIYIDEVQIFKSVAGTPIATPSTTPTTTATKPAEGQRALYLPVLLKAPPPTPTPTPTETATLLPTATMTASPTATKSPGNHPPEFPNPFEKNALTELKYNSLGQLVGATTTITILSPAIDSDGDPVTYGWNVTNGTVEGNGLVGTWERVIAFGKVQAGTVTITASDGRGGTDNVIIIFP